MEKTNEIPDVEDRVDRFLSRVCLAALCAAALLGTLMLLSGCVYRGAKVVEGTDLAVGLSVPATDGAADLTVFNYLSGFRLGVAKDAEMTVKYSSAETNSWFGVCTTRSAKTVEATVTPLRPADAANAEEAR